MSAEKLIEQADAYLARVDVDTLHPDVQSLAATYAAQDTDRGRVAFAGAIVRRAVRDGFDFDSAKAVEDMTAAELRAEVDRRNEGREEADLIVPDGKNKADLLAALTADAS